MLPLDDVIFNLSIHRLIRLDCIDSTVAKSISCVVVKMFNVMYNYT